MVTQKVRENINSKFWDFMLLLYSELTLHCCIKILQVLQQLGVAFTDDAVF